MSEHKIKPIRVCLIQHSTNSDNLGVGALTVSEVAILRDIGRQLGRSVEITIADWRDRRPSYVTGSDIQVVQLDGRVMVSPSGYWSLARRSDIVIDIGAGDSFSDIYGPKRLRWLFWLKALAHLAGTPLVMAPQTIGPFTKRWSRTLARWTMRKSALVASRDRLSTEEATNLGINNVIEASDLAMRLPYDPQLRVQTGSVRVGINVSALLMGGGYTKNNSFGLQSNYPELVRDLIRFFQNEGCEVHLVPHVVPLSEMDGGYSEDDANANSALAEEFPEVILAPHFATPSEAKTYISGLDFFMGARMHACIAAFSSGVPVVPMAYSRKFEGLFGSLGYHRTVDCTKQSRDEIFALIKMAFFKREDLAAEVRQSATHSAERVDRYTRALTEIMQEL